MQFPYEINSLKGFRGGRKTTIIGDGGFGAGVEERKEVQLEVVLRIWRGAKKGIFRYDVDLDKTARF